MGKSKLLYVFIGFITLGFVVGNLIFALNNKNEIKPSIGGISLGDSKEKFLEKFGHDFKEEKFEDITGFYDEDITIYNYKVGITILYGEKYKGIREIKVLTPKFQTDYGVKVGDTAELTFNKYNKFKKYIGRNSNNKELVGWYLVAPDEIMIFDFNKEDGSNVNHAVKPDSVIQSIKLAYTYDFN